MEKILDTISIGSNIDVTLEERLSDKGNEYICTCLNVGEKSIILSFDTKLYYKIKKGVNK